jgi:hypothetical protein
MSGHHDFENGYKRGYADGRSEMKENPIPWRVIRVLLEALEDLEDVATHCLATEDLPTLHKARVAIAKARGETL